MELGGNMNPVSDSDYSLVMSVTVPLLMRLPSESATETTALTTADLSLLCFLRLGSGPAKDWEVESVMLLE